MDRGRDTGTVGRSQREPDRVPRPRLDRDHRAARLQQFRSLLEDRVEWALVHEMVENEAVQDHVEGSPADGVRLPEPARVADERLVGSSLVQHPAHPIRVCVHGGQAERGRWEKVAARMPSGAHRQDLAARKGEPAGEQRPLALHHVPVVGLERLASAHPVQQISRVVWL